jgi:putative ATP-dependent endonuclease of the OLD family
MKIERIRISNFRTIKTLELFPGKHIALLGPNNTGKTAVLEALNLLLNPEYTMRSTTIDENDFFGRMYTAVVESGPVQPNAPSSDSPASSDTNGEPQQNREEEDVPIISIEAVLSGLTAEEEDLFRDYLVPWKRDTRELVETADQGVDPFQGATTAIRVAFEGRYDLADDDFACRTFFVTDSRVPSSDCRDFSRNHKRQIGFLIYRDFRGLTKPLTLVRATLFGQLLSSQKADPRNFDEALSLVDGTLKPITAETEFASILSSYKSELERFLHLSTVSPSHLSFELTDRTRREIRETAQLYVRDEFSLPLQKMGAGTRSLALLAVLTLIMRRRGRGILALEEPETFLFPHAQRRVIDECLDLAHQTFITTHSPYVLERIPAEGVGRLERQSQGILTWRSLDLSSVKHLNLYSKRIRQSFCEALLGKGVLIVEGDSDRWWIYGTSRIMNRKMWNDRRQEALELQGISVVSAESNSDIAKLGRFFHEAGLQVVCFADLVNDPNVVQELCATPFSVLFSRYGGLEDLLAEEVPVELARIALAAAPHSRVLTLPQQRVDDSDDVTVKRLFRDFLAGNKGSAQFHEWLMSRLDETQLPRTLREITDITCRVVAKELPPCRMSLI